MAVVDADYKFLYVNVGAQVSVSDGGVFNNCSFKKDLDTEALNLPQPEPLPGGQMHVLYVLVADDAFTLSPTLMKPYPGITDEESPQRAYNYRLSRARRVVENAFGIVSARFRVLRKPMHVKIETASTIILACCYLHNLIRVESTEKDHIDASIIAGKNLQYLHIHVLLL